MIHMIPSPFLLPLLQAGEVVEFLVDEGAPVEYKQAVLVIAPYFGEREGAGYGSRQQQQQHSSSFGSYGSCSSQRPTLGGTWWRCRWALGGPCAAVGCFGIGGAWAKHLGGRSFERNCAV